MTLIDGVDLRRLAEWMDGAGLPGGPIEQVERLGGGTQNILVRFVRGESTYVLRSGDAVSIVTGTPHQWENTTASPARVLIVSVYADSQSGGT